jgi:hypothetical protein
MKKLFVLMMLLTLCTFASEFVSNEVCKGCHATIYNEFYHSSHKKASIFENSIHKAVWDKHPDKQNERYTCAKCHTPTDTKLLNQLENNEKALPQKSSEQIQEGISCSYCHSITNIEKHHSSNKNILSLKEKVFYSANENNREENNKKYQDEISLFGLIKNKSGSPFHVIDYSNKNFYTGNMCMGCHSHLQNAQQFNLCETDEKGAKDEETNCISCHMPKIQGSVSSIKLTKEHRFHGFSSMFNDQKLLSKYIKINFSSKQNGFEISVKNEASHNLFLHPMRLVQLQVNVIRNNQTISLKTESFERILGNNNEPTMPWNATEELKNTMIKANERRVIFYDTQLFPNDTVEVTLGYYKVNPKLLNTLELQNDQESTQFNLLQTKHFKVE